MQYTIPPRFYDDHVARELPAGVVVKETKRHVVVELDLAEYEELLSDAQHYSGSWQFERELLGLCRSAQATVKALLSAGPPR